MKNINCPSCDCDICSTFPAPYSVKCGDKDTKDCKWLNFDFSKTSYSQYIESENEHK